MKKHIERVKLHDGNWETKCIERVEKYNKEGGIEEEKTEQGKTHNTY